MTFLLAVNKKIFVNLKGDFSIFKWFSRFYGHKISSAIDVILRATVSLFAWQDIKRKSQELVPKMQVLRIIQLTSQVHCMGTVAGGDK